jgi:hypothetical protein
MRKLDLAFVPLLACAGARAHEGHGMPSGFHWHATDVVGLAIVFGLAALAYWFSRDEE